jgi:hypothetical protein
MIGDNNETWAQEKEEEQIVDPGTSDRHQRDWHAKKPKGEYPKPKHRK